MTSVSAEIHKFHLEPLQWMVHCLPCAGCLCKMSKPSSPEEAIASVHTAKSTDASAHMKSKLNGSLSNAIQGLSWSTEEASSDPKESSWRPLLLIIPLRLGLSEINPVYINSLKVSLQVIVINALSFPPLTVHTLILSLSLQMCLTFRQSVGIIGGKPNHAHWFIGYLGQC